jgi:hypothetical protein
MDTAHTPLRARTVNAEDFTSPEIREKLFTPNAESNSAYDLLSDPQGTYILVAERGMGKTHALLVLEDQLTNRKDVVLRISPKSREVIDTYLAINRKDEYRGEKSSTKWQLAILEFLGLKLLDPSLKLRKKWVMFSNKRIKVLVNYYRKYQADELDNQLKNWTKQLKDVDKSTLTEFLISVETLIGKLTTSGKAEKKNRDSQTPSLESRISLTGDWVWDSLAVLRKQKHVDTKDPSMTKFLPRSKSIYVIADGLDQIEEIDNADLLGLVDAVKLLNEKSKEGLQSDDPNFKMVIALRAITYDYSIGDDYKNTTQLWGNIKRLSWENFSGKNSSDKDAFLKKMLANFIVAYSPEEIDKYDTDQVLDLIFPKEVVYFGRQFTPGIKFVFDYTERRPREILLLWQSASAHVDSGELYSTKLTAQNLVDGLRDYTISQLPTDIGTEYEAEFPGIKSLLAHLRDNRESTTRVVSKKTFSGLIGKFIYDIEEAKRPDWINKGSGNIIKILFHVGIIGILPSDEPYDHNWPRAQYAKDNPDKSLENSPEIVIRPAFWNYLTNIKTETYKRRLFLLNLYRELQSSTNNLVEILDSYDNTRDLEFALGRFLVLCDLVDKFSGHPEPSDWEVWTKVYENLQSLYGKFRNTPFCASKVELDRMIEEYKKVILEAAPSGYENNVSFISLDKFTRKTKDNTDYKQSMHSMLNWLNVRQKKDDPRRIGMFVQSLNVGKDSFYSILGDAIANIVSLIESRRSQ